MTKAWVERGLSLPCSEFFLSVLNTYGLQPHNICPNSYLLLSNFATLCEGHLGIRPDVKLWQFFFRVKKETKDKAMLNCGSMTFMLRPGRMYPPHDSHESVRYWNAGWFYEKNISVPEIHDGLPKFNNEPPEELASWSFIPSLSLTPILEDSAENFLASPRRSTGTRLHLAGSLGGSSSCARYIGGGKLADHTSVPVSGDTAEEVPEDEEEEEEQKHPARQPLDLRSVPAPSGSKAGPGEASAKKPKIDSDYRCHPNHQPRTHHKVYEEISGCWSYNSSSAKRFPHCSTAISSSGGSISPSCRKHSTGNNSDPSDLTSTLKAYATKFFNKLTETEKWELEQDLLNAMLNNAWGKPDAATSEIQEFKKGVGEFFDKLVCKQKVLPSASSSLATTSSELENLRSSYQELETKLKEAEQQKEQAEKQLAEKNSELIREKGEFVLKRNADSETIKRQQKELNGLRKYMETAEHHWDLLATNILEPLGYSERRRNKFPRDDVLSLAGDDCKDLISASRKICHNLSLKKSRTCGLRKLVKRMDILPELVTDLQASSARVPAMTLTMCLHNPEMDMDR
ncbi:hypothetical protein QYE76_044767 [Lolium multiflorum]|uniref:Transposase (putative) gypsy type domain-containing protein n=1 Tax=Lolium multiflorum TaxID=4521 RepID=A0AAD8TJB6_LOLMU|nr:hypothetical protein QYE76_044767 [Lolium multiflorum]